MFFVVISVPVVKKFTIPVAIEVTDLALIRSLNDYVLDKVQSKLFIVRVAHRFVMMVVRNLENGHVILYNEFFDCFYFSWLFDSKVCYCLKIVTRLFFYGLDDETKMYQQFFPL